MESKTKKRIIVPLIIISLILFIFVFYIIFLSELPIFRSTLNDCMWTECNGEKQQFCNWNEYVIAEKCCDGCFCTDTYYISEDNTCHLVLCEQGVFNNKGECVYNGK